MADKVEVEIILRGAKAARDVKAFVRNAEGGFNRIRAGAGRASKGLGILGKDVHLLGRRFSMLKAVAIAALSAIAIYAGANLSRQFIATAASVETLKIQLDTITKGKGLEWFKKLNEWALKMPVDTQGAIEVFKNLRAMGLQPTIEDMTVLVDTASALGGGADVMMGIARALGQMYTKGKVSAEELMQLAERGVPAYEILKQKLNLTGEELEDIAKSGMDVNKAIKALMDGMEERFGGASKAMQESGKGLWTSLVSYYKEFQRLVMESTVWDVIKKGLSGIIAQLDKMKETGKLKDIATETGATVLDVIATIIESAGKIPGVMASIGKAVATVGAITVAFGEAFIRVFFFWAKWKGDAIDAIQSAGVSLAKLSDQLDTIGPELAGWGDKTKKAAEGLREMADKARYLRELERIFGLDMPSGWEDIPRWLAQGAKGAKDTGEQLSYVVDGVKKVVGETEDAVGNFMVMKTIVEKDLPKAHDEQIKKLKAERDLLREHLAIYQGIEQKASKPGITSYTPGMKYGGPVLPMQGGGAIPGGWGGGDKIPILAEPGEEMLDKVTARYARQRGILDALREAAHGGRTQGYFVLDHRFEEGKAFPLTVAMDEVGKAFIEYLEHEQKTKGHF